MEKTRIYFLIGIFLSVISLFYFGIIDNDYMFWISPCSFLGLLVGLISWHCYSSDDKVNYFKIRVTELIKENNINQSKSVLSDSHLGQLILDHENNKLWIFRSLNNGEVDIQNAHYKDIVESNLIEDGNNLIKTSRSSQVAGALIGGALVGGVGAVIGGLSGNQTSSDNIKSLELKIVVNDIDNPVKTFGVKDSLTDFIKHSPPYKKIYNEGYELHKTLSLIIRQEEEKQNSAI